MKSRTEIKERLRAIEEEKEELMLEYDIYKSYDIIEEVAKELIEEINAGLSLTCIKVNLWRIEDINSDDDDWSLTANFCDIDNNIDIEKECKDLYDELWEKGWVIDDFLRVKVNKNMKTDLRWCIGEIIENLINKVMEELQK